MPCYTMYDKQRNPNGFICGDLGDHCSDCGDVGFNLCDFPVGDGKTCDRSLCEFHAHEVGPDIHYCEHHFKEWEAFRKSGRVKRELESVVPYKTNRPDPDPDPDGADS